MQDLINKLRGKTVKIISQEPQEPIKKCRCEFCGYRRYYAPFETFDGKTGHKGCIDEFIRIGFKLDLLTVTQKKEAKKREAEASQSANTGKKGENPVTACLGHHANPSC